MLKIKNKPFLVRLFVYSFSFFFLIFTILLLKFFQVSYDIDSNRISSNSIFYGLPSVELLREYKPKQLSKIISSDNKVLYEFYYINTNREVIDIDIIPNHLKNALIANEDRNFSTHYGIHIPSILRSFYINFISKKRAQGGSTITMQLSRNLYDTKFKDIGHEKTIMRKIKEIILAIKIEQVYTKNEILEMYLNSVYFGSIQSRPMWGIQKASKMIFGKDVSKLELDECALLIALLPAPNDRIPTRHPKNANKYRNIILKNMLDDNHINEYEYEIAITTELPTETFLNKRQITPYYVQYVEQQLKNIDGIDYKSGGLIIHTSIDSRIQKILDTVFHERMLDNSEGLQNNFNKTILKTEIAYNDRLKKICSCIESDRIDIFNDSLYIDLNRQIYNFSDSLDNNSKIFEDLKNRRDDMKDNLRQQCFGRIRDILSNKEENIPKNLRSKLLVQGAVIILDIKTGSVLGMLGGRQEEEYHDYFNRSTLATRQPGSVFKPFVYLTAINSGYSPLTQLINQGVKIKDKSKYWMPENWNNEMGGKYTLRQGLYGSVNLISVRTIYDEVPPYGLSISPKAIQKTAYNFHITTPINTVPSIALGSSEVKPIEITSAYSAIANSGIYMEPIIINKIMDKDGKLIKNFLPSSDVIESEASSYILLDMMRNVVDEYKFKFYDQNRDGKYQKDEHVYSRGTASKLRTKYNFGFNYTDFDKNNKFSRYNQKEINSSEITIPCAGKTGTTNLQTDAWFIGFTPDISMGVWVGMDDKRISLGENSYGSSAALPIFAEAMNEIYELGDYYINGNQYILDYENDSWDYVPEGISELKICRDDEGNICKANKFCRSTEKDFFLKEFEPPICE